MAISRRSSPSEAGARPDCRSTSRAPELGVPILAAGRLRDGSLLLRAQGLGAGSVAHLLGIDPRVRPAVDRAQGHAIALAVEQNNGKALLPPDIVEGIVAAD